MSDKLQLVADSLAFLKTDDKTKFVGRSFLNFFHKQRTRRCDVDVTDRHRESVACV